MSNDDTKKYEDKDAWNHHETDQEEEVEQRDHVPTAGTESDLPPKPEGIATGNHVNGIGRYLLPPEKTGAIRATRINVTLTRRTPHKHEWIRVHPKHSAPASILKLKPTNDTFLVAPEFQLELERHLTAVDLRLAVNAQGVPFIWPVRIPFEDRSDDWGAAALDAMQLAQTDWVRLEPDMHAQTYVIRTAPFSLTPQWPEEPFVDLLSIAFKRFLIDSDEHPVLRRLRGDAP